MVAKSLVVLSGGMDSSTALAVALEETHVVGTVGFNYGQKHSKELEYAEVQAQSANVPFDVVNLTDLRLLLESALTSANMDVPEGHYADENMKQTVVPNRNMIMFSIAAGIALARGADIVFVGVHAGDHPIYPDCRPEFVRVMNDTLFLAMDGMQKSYASGVPMLAAPFIHETKSKIAVIGQMLEVDYALTWSCYKGGDYHCGRCGTCVERKEAFRDGQVPDPTVYEDEEGVYRGN